MVRFNLAHEKHDVEDDVAMLTGKLKRSEFYWIDEGNAGEVSFQMVSAEGVARKYGIPERFMVKYLQGQLAEAAACRSLPFTLILVVSYSVMAIAHDDAITVSAVEGALRNDIAMNMNFGFEGPHHGHRNYQDVYSHTDFWSWLRQGFARRIFRQRDQLHESYNMSLALEEYELYYTPTIIGPEDRGFWLNYNRIVGGVRFAQERNQDVDLEEGGEDCETMEDMLALYNSPCVGGYDYDTPPELGLPSERAQRLIFPHKIFWLYVATDLDQIMAQLTAKEEEGWLNRGTKKIEIAVPSYNAEFGLHTLTTVNFYFSRGGQIWKLLVTQSQYASWHDRWYYGVYDAVWCVCLLVIFVSEVVQLQRVVRTKGVWALTTEYFGLWNVVDWLTLVGGWVILIIFFASINTRKKMNDSMVDLGTIEDSSSDQFKEAADKYFDLLLTNCSEFRHLRRALFLYPLIIIVRLFRTFSAQPKLAMVTTTVYRAAPDLFHFAVVFLTIFVTFAIVGVTLFGRSVEGFSTMSRAGMSCFRALLSHFSWEEIAQVGQTEAAIWLWLFILFMVLLMLNVILAILIDKYAEVKVEVGLADTLLQEAGQALRRWRGIRNGTYVPLEHVLDIVHSETRRARMGKMDTKISQMFTGMLVASNVKIDLSAVGPVFGEEEDHRPPPPPQPQIQQPIIEDEEVKFDHEHDIIVTVNGLRRAIERHGTPPHNNLSQAQALELISGAVQEYYDSTRTGADFDEVLQLIHKVSYKVKVLVKWTRSAYEGRGHGPLRELLEFQAEFHRYLHEVEQERNEYHEELQHLHKQKLVLARRLGIEPD